MYSHTTSQKAINAPPPMTMDAAGLPMKNGVDSTSAALRIMKSS